MDCTRCNERAVVRICAACDFRSCTPFLAFHDDNRLLLSLVFDVPYTEKRALSKDLRGMPEWERKARRGGGGRGSAYRMVLSTELVMNVWGSLGCHAQHESSPTCPLNAEERQAPVGRCGGAGAKGKE